MQLSQKRADAVLDALKKANANTAQLIGAEGYGSEYAKAAADAPDEEKQNRQKNFFRRKRKIKMFNIK